MPASPVQAIKNAPVATLSTAEALVGATLTFLVAHGVIGDVDVSATTQTIAPFVALALPAVFGALKWRLVSPYAKVKDMAERDGLVSDADFARLDALLDDKLHEWGLATDDDTTEDYDTTDDYDATDDYDEAGYDEAGYDAETDAETDDDADADADADADTDADADAVYVPEHSESGLDTYRS